MGRFNAIAKGPEQRKTITLPFPGASYDPIKGEWEGPCDKLDVSVVRHGVETKIVQSAIAFAKERGVETPRDGDELYERGKLLHTLLIACINKDSPANAPEPYFESLEEIEGSDLLLPETIEYLFQQQRTWQDEISPLRSNLSDEEYLAGIMRATQGDIDFFVSMRPGMQWSCFQHMASRLSSLMTQELLSTSQPASQPPSE